MVKPSRIAFLFVLGLAGCAAKEPAASPDKFSPPDEDQAGSTSLDDLEASLAQAERQLDAQLGASVSRSLDVQGQQQAPAAEPAEAPEPSRPTTPQPSPAPAPKPGAAGGSPAPVKASTGGAPSCDTVCKALASMERSADRICELTSAEDSRCKRAKERVETATQKVEQSGCGCTE